MSNRMDRLRLAVSKVDGQELRSTISALNHQDLAGLHPTERTALRALRSSRNPAVSILQAHYGPALQPVAEVLTHECLEATRQALGDAADEPTPEQLEAALERIRDQFPAPTVALLLAVTAAGDAPAADICDRILDDDAEFGLQDTSALLASAPSADVPGGVAPAPRPRPPRTPKPVKSAHKARKNTK